jgi:putative acetyltransferase
MSVRAATPSDYPAIRQVITHAFGRGDEANLVEQLRGEGDALVEFVAATDIAIYGHIFYSPLAIEREGETLRAAALAPLAVLPELQNNGLGGELIRAGNARCAELGCVAVIVLGHGAYYPRFGFSPKLAEPLTAPFSGPHFMALEFEPGALARGGRVRYPGAFGVD